MFELKAVPIKLIPKVSSIKGRLQADYEQSVLPQIPANIERPDFEYLFAYNMELFDELYTKLRNHENTFQNDGFRMHKKAAQF